MPYRAAVTQPLVRRLLSTLVLNNLGDQVATIAIAVLAFRHDHSATLSALPFALTYLPALLGLGLGGLADRFERRRVLIVLDVVQAALVAVLAIGLLPLAMVLAAMGILGLLRVPYQAARSALLADVSHGSAYTQAVSLSQLLNGLTVVAGFAAGGLLVALGGPRVGIAIDAGSFVLSAALVASMRSAPRVVAGRTHASLRFGIRVVWQDTRRRRLLLLVLAGAACLMAPEAVAVPVAAGHGAWVAGVLTAAVPAGFVGATLLQAVWGREAIQPLGVPVLAFVGAVALLATVLTQQVWVFGALSLVAGAGACYVVPIIATFNLVTPAPLRGRANALAAAALTTTQGAVFLAAGVLAQWSGRPTTGTAAVGAVSMLALPLFARRSTPAHPPDVPAPREVDVTGLGTTALVG